jgi:hypothetical protein
MLVGLTLVARILEGADASLRRAQEIVEKASDIAAALESPAMDSDSLLRGMSHSCKQLQDNHVAELKYLDGALRGEVRAITDAKVCPQVDENALLTSYRTNIPSNVSVSFDKSVL